MRFAASVATGRALPVAHAISAAAPLGFTPRIVRAVLPPISTAAVTGIFPALRMPMCPTTRMGRGMGLRRKPERSQHPNARQSRTRSRGSLARWRIERSAGGRSCDARTHPDGSRTADAGRWWHRAGWGSGGAVSVAGRPHVSGVSSRRDLHHEHEVLATVVRIAPLGWARTRPG